MGIEEQPHRLSNAFRISSGSGASESSGTVNAPAQTKRARTGRCGGDGPQLGYLAAIAHHDQVFPGFNPVQKSVRVPLQLL